MRQAATLAAAPTRDLPLGGRCGIPAGALSFNFTVVIGTQNGDLRFDPTGGSLPLVSAINRKAATGALANAAIVPLGTSGSIAVKSDAPAAAALVIDLNGRGALSSAATGLNAPTGAPRPAKAGRAARPSSAVPPDPASGSSRRSATVDRGEGGGR